MKVHYKTIVVERNPKYPDFDPSYKKIIENKGKPLIDYCCDDMKNAVRDDTFEITCTEFYLQREGFDEGGSCIETQFPAISFCPYCGEKIEYIEDYKAQIVTKKVKIPAQTIPAREETKTTEVRIK